MFKSLLTICLILSPISVLAETSEQYIHRSEFFFCNFNDGKNYDDLLEEQAPYEDFLKENNYLIRKNHQTSSRDSPDV